MEGYRDFSHRRGTSEPPEIPEHWHYNNNRFAPFSDDSSLVQRPVERDRVENYFPIEARAASFNNGTPFVKEENNISRNHQQSLQTERGYGDAPNYANNSTELNIDDWNIDEEYISLLASLEPASADVSGESTYTENMARPQHQASSSMGSRPLHRRAASDSIAYQQDYFGYEYSNDLSAIADEGVKEQSVEYPMMREHSLSFRSDPLSMHSDNSFSKPDRSEDGEVNDRLYQHMYCNQMQNHALKQVKQEPGETNGTVAIKVENAAQKDPIMFQRGKLTTSRSSQSVTNRQIELAEAYADLTSSGAECVDGDAAVLLALASPAAKKADPAQLDPKKAKRIMANRQSAYRSRMRRLQYIEGLERNVKSLEDEIKQLKTEYVKVEKSVQEKEAESKQLESQLQNAQGSGSNHYNNGDYDLDFCMDVVTNGNNQ